MNTSQLENIADLDRVGMMQMARCKQLDKEIEDEKSETEIAKLKTEKAETLKHLRSTLALMETAFSELGMHV